MEVPIKADIYRGENPDTEFFLVCSVGIRTETVEHRRLFFWKEGASEVKSEDKKRTKNGVPKMRIVQ
jgi:hypothetical protein